MTVTCDGNGCDNCSFSLDPAIAVKDFCLWCPLVQKCQHIESSTRSCVLEKERTNEDDNKVFKEGPNPCPIIPINEELRDDNPLIVPLSAALIAAGVIVIAVIAGIAFALRAKSDSGLLESEAFLNGDNSMAIRNPMYEMNTQMSVNKLYEGGGGGGTDN